MKASIFNTEFQQKNITSKIVVGLERISEVFRALLWKHAKTIGLSPIQIQLLIFIAYHKQHLCNVSHLAKEFNVTKPTISDAVRVLHTKEFIQKEYSTTDSRRYTISNTVSGTKIVKETEGFADPIKNGLLKMDSKELETFYTSLTTLIYSLNKNGVLSVQRTCYACKFYQRDEKKHFCNYLNKELRNKEIRLDCLEFEEKG